MSEQIDLTSEVAGYYTLEILKVGADGKAIEGSKRQPVPTFRNLITNAGLDRMGAFGDYCANCQVGSGSTPPTVNDSTLAGLVASKTLSNATATTQSAAPYYTSTTLNYEFAAGVAAGNLSEVGVGWAVTGSLFSRALIVDGSGNPTTITILADEILRVSYQLRYYVPTADLTGTITLNGVSIDWVSRAAEVVQATSWTGAGYQSAGFRLESTSYQSANDGDISASVTGGPGGTSSSRTGVTDAAYSAGSYARSGTLTWDIGAANFAGGIKSLYARHGIGTYQIGFTPPIMKTSSQTLTLTLRHSWARKAI
jgi:hypothetical protein